MTANIPPRVSSEISISKTLALIGQPARVQILLAISTQEACVCHLEAIIHARQASISQHLMVLRKAGLVITKRDGHNIFYRLANPEVVSILRRAALLAGVDVDDLECYSVRPVAGCPCPQCNPGVDPALTCGKMHSRSGDS
ncbi:MAG TPA: metalloregulator ArsR/SmtB family transcription factor [Anaerolineaceae bacterium]|nr:metalloregulator ArsR/SmtB family transcription factor [Anaerolineaceae bacterium]